MKLGMRRAKTLISLIAVVAASAILGIFLGQPIVMRTTRASQYGARVWEGPVHPLTKIQKSHIGLVMDMVNHGKRGELGIAADLRIGPPMKRPGEIPTTIAIDVEDAVGTMVINRVPIGQTSIKQGEGNWSKMFYAVFPLDPGTYKVHVYALDNFHGGPDENGVFVPNPPAGHMHTMVVR